MNWWSRPLAAAGVALLAAAAALVVATAGGEAPDQQSVAGTATLLLLLAGVGWAAWRAVAAGGSADAEPFATPAPERTTTERSVSGESFAKLVADATERARREGDPEAGYGTLRPELRAALIEALVEGGADRRAASEAVDAGAWTDDSTAAAVLSADVTGPARPLRARLGAWLFPERVLREDARRAVDAVEAAASDALPAVPGQSAPRSVPVAAPDVVELRPVVDGTLQPALEDAGTTGSDASGDGDGTPTADGTDGSVGR